MPEQSTLRKLIIRNVQVVLLGLLVNQGVQTLARAIMARHIQNPAVFGEASILLQILTMTGLLLNFGMNTAETYFLAKHGKKTVNLVYQTALGTSLATGVVIAAVLALLAPLIATLYGVKAIAPAVAIGSISLIFNSGTKVGLSLFSGFRKFAHQSIAMMTNSVLTALGIIVGVLLSPSQDVLTTLGISISVFALVAFLSVLALIKLLHGINPGVVIRWNTARQMLRFGLPMWAGNLAKSFQQPFLVVLTGAASMTAAGFLNNGLQIVGFLHVVTWSFTVIGLPMLSEVIHDAAAIKERGTLCFRYNNFILFPLTTLVILFPGQITQGLFGAKYVNVEASQYVQLLAVGVVFSSISRLAGAMLAGLGKPRGNFYVMTLSGGLLVILSPLLMPISSMLGPIVYACGWGISALVIVWFLLRDGLLLNWIRSFIDPLVPTMVMLVIVEAMVHTGRNSEGKDIVALCLGVMAVIAVTWLVEHRDRKLAMLNHARASQMKHFRM